MIVQFITAIALSVVLILMTWAVFRTLKKPMPGSLIPLIAGVTVIGYGIYSEYTWESRTLEKMPESMEVIHRLDGKSVFSPWSYVLPRTDKLSLVDTSKLRRNNEYPDYVMLDLLMMQRFNPVLQIRQLVDCRSGRRADLATEPEFDEQGLPVNLRWDELPAEHRLLEVACS